MKRLPSAAVLLALAGPAVCADLLSAKFPGSAFFPGGQRDFGSRIREVVANKTKAEQDLENARRDLAKSLIDTIVAQLKLKQAVGRLTEDDLGAVNRLLRNL